MAIEPVEVIERRQQARELDKTNYGEGIHQVYIDSFNPETELMKVTSVLGRYDVNYHHPYVSFNSWIRTSPEQSTPGFLSRRADTSEFTWAKFELSGPEDYVQSFMKDGTTLYRPLKAGEIEVNSKGFAQTWWSSRPIHETHGGVVRSWENQDELESGHRSPIHRRCFHKCKDKTLGDEIREGIVKRNVPGLSTKTFFPPTLKGFPGKEVLVNLFSGDPTNAKLLYHRQGNVFSEAGIPEIHGSTSLPLRLKNIWYTNTAQELSIEIDEMGNTELKFPIEAAIGVICTIPQGNLLLNVGQSINIKSYYAGMNVLTVQDINMTSTLAGINNTCAKPFTVTSAASIDMKAPLFNATIAGATSISTTGTTLISSTGNFVAKSDAALGVSAGGTMVLDSKGVMGINSGALMSIFNLGLTINNGAATAITSAAGTAITDASAISLAAPAIALSTASLSLGGPAGCSATSPGPLALGSSGGPASLSGLMQKLGAGTSPLAKADALVALLTPFLTLMATWVAPPPGTVSDPASAVVALKAMGALAVTALPLLPTIPSVKSFTD